MKEFEISQRFLDYYKNLGYQLLPSASLMDDSIPMSFVMSAGLVQIELSLARNRVKSDNKFTLMQNCFRHFDLDRVGTDDLHLSFFNMLGAFEFVEKRKADTVHQMWKLATSVLGIDATRVWASYFQGGIIEGNNISEDSAVRQAWQRIGIPSERIVGLGPKDNYWIQGKGLNSENSEYKCGPNTELFFDRGENCRCRSRCQPGCKCGRFIEFSNSLFIHYKINQQNGKFEKLDNTFSETVIGTERVAMILQKVKSIFEIESFQKVINIVHQYVTESDLDISLVAESERLITDHLKALYFLIADGAPHPGKMVEIG